MTAAPKPAPPADEPLDRRVDRLERELTETRRSLWRARAVIAHPALADVVDLLDGSDESEVLARAARLAAHVERKRARHPEPV
ncbi:hypothetical protein [Agromyces kandeliae]|uniref:Uncharacterized protein n=1 Tax=Agromyces kandeliae TaxID=2666141 RepID=A0A6L5QXD7_9MICO|nr:hypothetical protein [Agromyces kandeliae]MRX42349.1 hypothetical protein [Agromyces kandeliae]